MKNKNLKNNAQQIAIGERLDMAIIFINKQYLWFVHHFLTFLSGS